ncbi:MAG: proton-conducting transporter membrane subunit, partial [Bryobacteraceae bacterium]
MLSQQETLLISGAAIPLVCFFLLALFGSRMGKPLAGWFASAGIAASTVLAGIVLYQWFRLGRHDGCHAFLWSKIGGVPVTVGVHLDALTVIMFFMVSFVSTCIFVFSIGYMAGHSDEIDGQSKYHRFFTFLSLFCFSMLGLVLSHSILFLFIFWELVGLCSYFLIGFYFHKKSASNAAIKAFVVNRVGDFGFLIGLMMVFLYLRDLSLAGAADAFRAQHATGGPLFARSFLGMSLAT